MGDRTYVNIRIHKDDIDEAVQILAEDGWLHSGGAAGREALVAANVRGELEVEEVNYGGDDTMDSLAAAGVRFVASHSGGDAYQPEFIYHINDGQRHSMPLVHGEYYIIPKKEGTRYVVDPAEVDVITSFDRNYEFALHLVHQSWEEQT